MRHDTQWVQAGLQIPSATNLRTSRVWWIVLPNKLAATVTPLAYWMSRGWLATSAIQTSKLGSKQYKTKQHTDAESFLFQAHSGSQGVWLHSPCHDSLQDFVSWGMLVSSRDWICCFQNRIDLPSILSRRAVDQFGVDRKLMFCRSAIFLHSCEIFLLRFWSTRVLPMYDA